MLDRRLHVHTLAPGELVLGWWTAGVLRGEGSWLAAAVPVDLFGRLVLTTQRIVFEPDSEELGRPGRYGSFRIELALSVPLDLVHDVAPYGDGPPPRLAITAVDGQARVLVVYGTRFATQWSRDPYGRDTAVWTARDALSRRIPRPVDGPVELVPAALVAAAAEGKRRARRSARRELIAVVVVGVLVVAGFVSLVVISSLS